MKKFSLLLFLLSVLTLSFLPLKDTDFGWHYRCGETFLTTGRSCTQNDFSYFLADYKASNPSFLYDILIAKIYDTFGFVGLSFLGSAIISLCALLIYKLLSGPLFLRFVTFYLIWFLAGATFLLGLRSQILTFFFFLVLLLILKKSKDKPQILLITPVLFLAWINSHIGFFVGLLVLIFFLMEKREKNTVFVTGLSFMATLLNPFGINVYREIINHATSPLGQMIAEWVAPPPWTILMILTLSLFLLVILLNKEKISLFNILLLIFFTLLAIKARRNLPFFYTTFFYLLLKQLNINRLISEKIYLPIITSALVTLLFFSNIRATVEFDRSWEQYCTEGLRVYPCQAIERYPELSGNVYAAYEWGGFIIWQKPEIKIFVDGRMPAWRDEEGKSPYQVYLEIIQARSGWNEKLQSLKTDFLLIENGTFLDLLLQKEAANYNWEEKYRDPTAVIYKAL